MRSEALQWHRALAAAAYALPPPARALLASAAAEARVAGRLPPLPAEAATAQQQAPSGSSPADVPSVSGAGGEVAQRPRRREGTELARAKAEEDAPPAAVAQLAAADPDDADGIADLRRELGFGAPGEGPLKAESNLGAPGAIGKGGAKARAVAAAAAHAAHVARLRELRGDPAALAAYLIEEGERPGAGDKGLVEAGGAGAAVAATADGAPPSPPSRLPAGYRNWGEVAAALSTNAKRSARAEATLKSEQTVKLRQGITPVREATGPSRRQQRVAANIARVLTSVLARREVGDAGLYPRGLPIEIADVSVTPDLRTAYVRWVLPFPVRNLAAEAAAASGGHPLDAAATLGGWAAAGQCASGSGSPQLDMAGLAVRRQGRAAAAAAMAPTSAASATLMAALASRNARDRGMVRIDTPGGAGPSASRRRGAAAAAAEIYGDDAAVEHLDASAAATVATVTAAVSRNTPALKRAVGFGLRMQFMPTLEFHRLVAAEVQDAAVTLLATAAGRVPAR